MKQRIQSVVCVAVSMLMINVSAARMVGSVAADPQADRVIQEFKAAAGRSKNTSVLTLNGEGGSKHDGVDTDCPFWLRLAYPNMYQTIDRHLPIQTLPGGNPMVYTNNRGNGWLWERQPQPYLPFLAPTRTLSPNEAAEIVGGREALRFALGVVPDWASESGLVTLTYRGSVSDGQKELTELSVSDRHGTFADLRFDSRTHLPDSLRYRFVGRVPATVERTIVMRYSDFRPVSGLVVPFAFGRQSEAGVVSPITRIRRYAPNDGLKPTVFVKLPAAQMEASLPSSADIKR